MTTITDKLAAALRALAVNSVPWDHTSYGATEIEELLNEGYNDYGITYRAIQNAREALAAYDAQRFLPDPKDSGQPRWRAQLLNEHGYVEVTGTEAAVKRCIELGRFERGEQLTATQAIADLVFDLEAIGFGDEDNAISGSDTIDVINLHLPVLRGVVAKL